jgi:hypothetical protein
MLSFRRRLHAGLVVLGGLTLVLAGTAAAEKPEIFPLSKVKRGLKGYGMTTFAGTTPERFEFEVIGVLHNMLPDLDIVMVKSDDPKVQVSGFWAGMSGSPLYVDGKVMCAFSYGWRFTKTPIGGCTPLESMMADSKRPLRGSPDVTTTNPGGKKKVKKAKKGKTSAQRMTTNLPTQVATLDDWKRLTPNSDLGEAMDSLGPPRSSWLLSTPLPAPPTLTSTATVEDSVGTMAASLPLSIAGFTDQSFGELDQLFGAYGMEPVRASGTGSPSADGPTTFQMGASIAVQLIRGPDMSMASTGTVSYVDGDTVLAFGHPMFETGETYAPVSTAEVITVMPSLQSSFVMALPMNEAGALVEDRQSHIKADTSLRHPMIPVDVYVSSGEGKSAVKQEFHAEIWNNKFFAGSLAGSVASNAINTFYPDRADASARIVATIEIHGEKKPLKFVDYLYANDGAGSLVGGARGLRVLVPLLLNPWSPLTIDRIEMTVDLSFDTNYGDIKELRMPAGELVAGKTYFADVVLESYGKKDIVEQVPFDVPESLAGQIVTLEIGAGDSARLDAAPAVDLKSLLKLARKLLPGDIFVASLYGADQGVAIDGIAVADLPASVQDRLHPQSSTQTVEDYRAVSRTTSPSKRVINGTASAQVKIADKKR